MSRKPRARHDIKVGAKNGRRPPLPARFATRLKTRASGAHAGKKKNMEERAGGIDVFN